jgi:hypothetical protein
MHEDEYACQAFLALRQYPLLYAVHRYFELFMTYDVTNATLAETFDTSPRTISFCVTTLMRLGFLRVATERRGASRPVLVSARAPQQTLDDLRNGVLFIDMKRRTLDESQPMLAS